MNVVWTEGGTPTAPTPSPVAPTFAAADSKVGRWRNAGIVAVVVLVAIAGLYWWAPLSSDFAALGRSYPRQLGKAYAPAWRDGAKLLDAGQSTTMALDTVKQAWDRNRLDTFNRVISPHMSKILPEAKDEKSVTDAERKALAEAWREFARGLEK